MISLIAAMSQNRVIGNQNKIPWRLPQDQQRFKQITLNHPIIMGRKTYESMGRPLPNRHNIILTHSSKYQTNANYSVAKNIDEAVAIAQQHSTKEIFVIGGEEIYKQFLDLADRIYLTVIYREYPGDTFFPEFESKFPTIIKQEDYKDHDPPFSYITYSK